MRAGRAGALVLTAGVAAGALLVVADLATLRSVHVLTASCGDLASPGLRASCVTKGHEAHSYALVVIGAASLVMAWGAGLGRSRAAAVALAALGLVALVIALARDVPNTHKTGVIGEQFEEAKAEPGPGLWLELGGGALALVTGAAAATRRRR